MRVLIAATIVLMLATPASAMSLLVDKSDRRLFVYSGELGNDFSHKGQLLASYPIVIGKNPIGKKQRAGDMRTPEGTYRLTRRECQTCRFKRAYALNYPNRQDRREGRTGSAILIHGGAGPFYWWTAGCIALSNADFDKLWAMVPDRAELVIRP